MIYSLFLVFDSVFFYFLYPWFASVIKHHWTFFPLKNTIILIASSHWWLYKRLPLMWIVDIPFCTSASWNWWWVLCNLELYWLNNLENNAKFLVVLSFTENLLNNTSHHFWFENLMVALDSSWLKFVWRWTSKNNLLMIWEFTLVCFCGISSSSVLTLFCCCFCGILFGLFNEYYLCPMPLNL